MYYLVLILFFFCDVSRSETGNKQCENNNCNIISMPLMERGKATLKADIDLTEMNTALKSYIKQELENEVHNMVDNISQQIMPIMRDFTEKIMDEKLINIISQHGPIIEQNSDDLNMTDCDDLKEKYNEDGLYPIYPTGKPGYKVYCDMTTDGGGWTVIQRRYNGELLFHNKPWVDYANGFGHPHKEHWLGNDRIHQLTTSREYVLRIDISDWDNTNRYAEYSKFVVDHGELKYKLHIGGFAGNAGNSMAGSNNQSFSTFDNQNDGRSKKDSCTELHLYNGAWWFPDSCGYSDLNGEYIKGGAPTNLASGRGIIWFGFRGFGYSLKRSTMMIRRKK